MSQYNIKYTDVNVPPIQINDGDINTQSLDIALFGHIKLEYGELLNENFLHILENFACPQDPTPSPSNLLCPPYPVGTILPDLSIATSNTLSHPSLGQVWFNTTDKKPYVCTNVGDGDCTPPTWIPLATNSDYAANWGKIYHGQQLPLPISESGYEFAYSECVWILTPSGTNVDFQYMVCTASADGLVNHQYALSNTGVLIDGIANYMIIGIRSNINNGVLTTPPNPPALNLTPTPSITPTISPSVGTSPTPTPTQSITPTPSITQTITPTITPSLTPTITPSSTKPPIQGTVFISPSLGWYNKFLSDNRCAGYSLPAILAPSFDCIDLTHLEDSTLAFLPNNTCLPMKRLEVWVTDITGGDGGPYSLEWNLTFFYSCFANGAPATLSPIACTDGIIPNFYPVTGITYTGGSSGYICTINYTTSLVIPAGPTTVNNVIQEQFAYWRAIANRVLERYGGDPRVPAYRIVSPYSISLTLLDGSSVIVRDNSGNSTKYYIPSGSGGAVSGTQLITAPGGNYSDSYSAIRDING